MHMLHSVYLHARNGENPQSGESTLTLDNRVRKVTKTMYRRLLAEGEHPRNCPLADG